ncbi:GNAT family N-acetyltransferase [Stakelama tenebrarum]|uniref:N-acetyltransferase n=1 Tax=Stakelama tenebrarum TaxID=2711215 RepID=A0A6G6YA75_9SPHN|nr:GNAT family N-acetyltransferase [Sphingosinithalassobacter tenebrarum]QIG81476.1 N-acetyltransferase [Sphingosinithalassobacter tenebrarum]
MIDIREARAEDAHAIAEIYAPHVVAGTVSFETSPPDSRTMRRRMTASEGYYPWLVLTDSEAGGAAIGYAYAGRFRERDAYSHVVETAIYMAEGSQRRGYGRLLYSALVATLRAQGFTQAVGGIALPNDASIRLHEAVGYRQVGIFREIGFKAGQWLDVGFWQCELRPATLPPPEIRPFGETGLVRD